MEQTFDAILRRFDSQLWGHHFMVPDHIVVAFKNNNVSRLQCIIDGSITLQCAPMSAGNGEFFVNVNKEVRTKLKWRIGQKRQISLTADTSKYGIDMPEELEELLAIDDDGSQIFHQLTPGKQRSLIYLAAKPKQSATRLKKSIIMIDYLKDVHGKLDFKELNQAFKDRKDEVFG